VEQSTVTNGRVRCLDCGTEYDLVSVQGEAVRCPACGGVGWVSLRALRETAAQDDDS
jgi:rRNA maturation endonuclease Nob1